MFAAPPVVETDVFAELPPTLRLADRKSKWVEFRKKGQPSTNLKPYIPTSKGRHSIAR
jgi:hypothetical protein